MASKASRLCKLLATADRNCTSVTRECSSKHTLAICLWASYQIRKIGDCACAGNVFPRSRFQRKPIVSDPACTCRDACRDRLPAVTGKTFPAFPAHAHPQFCVSDKRPMPQSISISSPELGRRGVCSWFQREFSTNKQSDASWYLLHESKYSEEIITRTSEYVGQFNQNTIPFSLQNSRSGRHWSSSPRKKIPKLDWFIGIRNTKYEIFIASCTDKSTWKLQCNKELKTTYMTNKD